jgi:hypothetical protein
MGKQQRRGSAFQVSEAISTKESRKANKRSFGKGKKTKSKKKSKGK